MIQLMGKQHQRTKLCNLYAIPLPNGKYGFGRQFKDETIAVYCYVGQTIDDVPQIEDYQFFVDVYKDVLTCGEWPIVGNRPFRNENDSWSPPRYIWDMISGRYSQYYRGQITASTKSACADLSLVSVWEAHHIIDRIMGDDTWQKLTPEWAYIKRFGKEAFDEFTKNS
jgi:hypothetical protein